MTDKIELIAKEIVALFWREFEPAIKEAFQRKLIEVASEAWRTRWSTEEQMSALIRKAIDEHLATTFKPALDEIAKKKARQKVEARATKNDIQIDGSLWPKEQS